MVFSNTRQMSCNSIIFTLLALSQVSTATLSLQDLQPIAHFPPACEAAYETPIPQCPPASSFSLTSTGTGNSVCSQDCFNALNKATTNIQTACQGTAAPPGTVIAHAFYGDLAAWLCSLGGGGSSQPASATNPGVTTSAASSTSAASTSVTSPNTSGSPSSSSSSSSSSTDSATASTSASTSASSSTTITTQTSKSKSSPTNTSTSTFIPNDGSPFDQTVPANAAPSPTPGQNVLFAAGVVLAIAVGS